MANLLLLGDVALTALQVSGLQEGRAWNWVGHETIEDLPPLQRVGKQAREPKLTVRLHPLLGAAAPILQGLEAAGERGDVMPLQLGNGYLFGWFVLTAIDRPWEWAAPDGTLIAATLVLSLRESRPPEQLTANIPVGIFDFAPPERMQPAIVDSSVDPADVPLSEIARM